VSTDRRTRFETDAETSKRMTQVRRHGTAPELKVRAVVRRLGHHYRLDNRDLPGSPDLANRSKRWAIFVHGCFWHRHPGCRRATTPAQNREAWVEKFASNRRRDARVVSQLAELGFTTITVWECELRDPAALEQRLRSWFSDLGLGGLAKSLRR
jgi:DNA mismatch endonuclease, patch repair protein